MYQMSTMITPEDILKQRAANREAMLLAHSPNSSGDFFARSECSCYTYRDALDPTGQEDARIQNEINTLPTEPPKLERQNAVCFDCDEECRPRKISLPPPSESLWRHPFTPSLSPILGTFSPRSPSDVLANSQDQFTICYDMEQKVKIMLQKLKRNYNRLENILGEEDNFRSHDEMAANDQLLTETINKIDAIDTLLEELNRI
jgi:hypothetical protein